MTDITKSVEYRLKDAPRYIITRHAEFGPEDGPATTGLTEYFGEFTSLDVARGVIEKLARHDHATLTVLGETIFAPTPALPTSDAA